MIFNINKKYIAAVSGGPDSMAMLDKYHKNIVGVCHVNYHKRVDSDYDTSVVIKYCKEKKIPCAVLDVDKSTYEKSDEHNFQTLARNIRYDFFVKCSKKFKCKNLLIAHNLNDFLETAIMQEKRNSLNFFYGIKETNEFKGLKIYRPLLNEFKKDLEQYCLINHIPYAIDSSNASDIYERNRIRKQLNKLSKKELLKKYANICLRNQKLQLVEKKVNKLLKQWETLNWSVDYFKKSKFNQQIQSSLIYLLIKKYNININHNKIKLVEDFVLSDKSNISLRLGEGYKLVKKNRQLKMIKE